MPITKIIIENFKGIKDRVEIPIRPITLLFGANSAGKSTILHALLYLREILERQNVDADRVIGGGNDVYLGGFRQLVHGHDDSLTVTVGVEFAVDADGCLPYPIQDQTTLLASINKELRVEATSRDQRKSDHERRDAAIKTNQQTEALRSLLSNGIPGVEEVSVEVKVGIPEDGSSPMILGYEVAINRTRFGEIRRDSSLLTVLEGLATRHPIFSDFDSDPDSEGDLPHNEFSEALEQALACGHTLDSRAGRDQVLVISGPALPAFGEALDFELDEPDEGDQRAVARLIISQLMVRPGELVRDHLLAYRHLGPIRAVPDLSSIAQRSPSLDRWINGMAAWDLLSVDAESKSSKKGQLIERVDSYLKDEKRLNLGYSLEAETVREIAVDSTLNALIERYILNPDDFEGEAMLKTAYADALDRSTRTRLQLIDLKRGIPVNPSDIGAGVSQVIPVLVSVLDTGSKITAIEQPEIHLHPAVQCALGDLFVRAVNKADERFFMIETHSEHLLLRLMRRMRETQKGAENKNDLRLGPDAITILFVETFEGRSVYREMPLNERGELVKAWPGGFFEEDMNELF